MKISPDKLTVTENYKLLIGSILPRPIALVSTISEDDIPNLAPFSFFTGVSSKPPTVCFSAAVRARDDGLKDTLLNIRSSGEFVINTVHLDIGEKMNECATEYASDVNEFEMSGLTPIDSEKVRPSRVKEALISFECRLNQIVEVGPQAAGGGAIIIGEILLFHVADHLIDDRYRIDTAQLNPLGRLAGTEFTKLGERFSLNRQPPPARS